MVAAVKILHHNQLLLPLLELTANYPAYDILYS